MNPPHLTVYMPASVLKRIGVLAKTEKRSLSAQALQMIEEGLEKREKPRKRRK